MDRPDAGFYLWPRTPVSDERFARDLFIQQHVTVLSPTIALVTGEGEVSVETEDGRTFDSLFAQSVVFLQTEGEWKVYHSHRSFAPAR